VLLENYQSDSLVGADEDRDQEVGGSAVSHPKGSSATKPERKTRAAASKQSNTRGAAKGEVAKTAKLEAGKKKRKRKTSPPSMIPTPMIPTLATKEVKEDEDEAIDDLPGVEERATRRSPSSAAKRQQELEQHVIEENLRRMREAQRAAAGAQDKMLVKIQVQPLRPKLRVSSTMRYKLVHC
jgi:hypothetical protein